MSCNCLQVMAVRIKQRDTAALEVQKILTEFGCSIMTRLGLHDQSSENTCMPSGLLILQLCCEDATSKELETKLNSLEGVKAKLVNLAD
jgi:hypothetical protein